MNINKILKFEIKISRLIVVTIFWVMLAVSILMSGVLIKYCSNIHLREDMQFIKYNFIPLAKAVKNAPEGWRPFGNFNMHCMMIHIKETIANMNFFILTVLFFNINTFILLFIVYRKKKRFLYMMCILMVMYTYFTFSYCHKAAEMLPYHVMGEFMPMQNPERQNPQNNIVPDQF